MKLPIASNQAPTPSQVAGQRSAARRGPSDRAPPPALSAIERALGSLGVLLACASVTFAGYMLEGGGGGDRLRGLAHLGIFAMPNSRMAARGNTSTDMASSASRSEPLDMTPIGLIAKAPRLETPASSLPGAERYVIAGIAGQRAWLGNGGGFFQFGVGDYVPGLGRILAIDGEDGRWRVVTTGGEIVKTRGGAQGVQPFARAPVFSRSLIFDSR